MSKIPPIKALLFMKGHSERVPRKNMREFCGRPLFHWIMDVLTQSHHIGEIIINTDSEEIAASARSNFDVTIHMRPDHLLTITSNEANQIMAHDLSITGGEWFLQTHSTNPLLLSATVDRAVETFFSSERGERDSLFTVTPIQKRFYFSDGRPVNHDPEKLIKTQELPTVYEENSCIYLFSRSVFNERGNRIGTNPMLLPMDPYEAVDIDEPIDWSIAEAMMQERLSSDSRGTAHE
ncbi:MAG: acylneuraminate cytidylyltransferase family protein [bacterium]